MGTHKGTVEVRYLRERWFVEWLFPSRKLCQACNKPKITTCEARIPGFRETYRVCYEHMGWLFNILTILSERNKHRVLRVFP